MSIPAEAAGNGPVYVYEGEALARYGFGGGHPFGTDRHDAFWAGMREAGLEQRVTVREPVAASDAAIQRFHAADYLGRVKAQSLTGQGLLDYGDTPAFRGVYEAAGTVVGSVLDAVAALMSGECRRAFVPIAGLHHARRDMAGGFCVFNDCGVAIETLLGEYALGRVLYVDIDAHHGDGVFYAFERDPRVIVADYHEDGRFLYPGTGFAEEIGSGEAAGTKLNIPLQPYAEDGDFFAQWPRVEQLIERFPPDFIILQCGADSLAGDPVTHLAFTDKPHYHTARRLCELADALGHGRVLGVGGGGYNRGNLRRAWVAVVRAFLDTL